MLQMRLRRKDIGGSGGGSYGMALVIFVIGVFNWSMLEDTKSDSQHRGPVA